MDWLLIAVVLGVAGLVVVAVCVVRVALALRRLSREIRRIKSGRESIRTEPAYEPQKTGTGAR